MMKKLFPIALILCMVGAWAVLLVKNSGPDVQETYYANAKTAYENEYYKETLEWLNKMEAAQDAVPAYEAAALKRDAYRMLGDGENYLGQCRLMTERYPEAEENYVLIIKYYQEQEDWFRLYRYLPAYTALLPENGELAKVADETDRNCQYRNLGYYDVRQATESLIDVQKVGGTAEEPATRKLCRSDGDVVFDADYTKMVVSQTLDSCFVCDQEGTWKLVDIQNRLLAQNRDVTFTDMARLSAEGIATAKIGDEIHFINSEMRVSDLVWEDAGTFNEGINAVKKNGMWALVDTDTWTTVAEFPYTDIPRNSLGACCVEGVCVVADQSGYYLIDSAKRQPISENRYEELKAFECKQPTAYRSGDKWGFIRQDGSVYIEACYEDARPYRNGYAAVKQNGLWGYIDRYGKAVVEPQFQEVLDMLPDGIAYVRNELGYWDSIRIDKLYYESQQE